MSASQVSGAYPTPNRSRVSSVKPRSARYWRAGSACVAWRNTSRYQAMDASRASRSRFRCRSSLAPWAETSTPAFSARRLRASRKSSPSRFMTKVKMSPCSPQPKQCHDSRSGLTVNEGVFSTWNGHRPFQVVPARLSWTVSPTISVTGRRDLISATVPVELMNDGSRRTNVRVK